MLLMSKKYWCRNFLVYIFLDFPSSKKCLLFPTVLYLNHIYICASLAGNPALPENQMFSYKSTHVL